MLFILPNSHLSYPLHPLGVTKLAAILREKGNDVEILDMDASNITVKDLGRCLDKSQPNSVGISYRTANLKDAREIRDFVKNYDDNIKVLVGGADVTARKLDSVRDVDADLGVVGEGEDLISIIVNHQNEDLSTIKGLILKDKKGKLHFTGEREPIRNLDVYPFTAYDLLNLDNYRTYPINLPRDYLTMITSRGCPFSCIFCFNSMFGKFWRANSPEYVVNEIEHCKHSLPLHLKSILFLDDSFTVDKDRIYQLCRLIKKRDIDLTFKFETRVDLINHALLKAMFDVGFKHISFGVESGNAIILHEWEKGITKDQVRKAFKTAKKIGFCVTAYMIIGAPSETPKTIQDSIDFAKELKADFTQWSVAAPIPQTKLAEWYIHRFGAIKDWSKLYYSNVFCKQKQRFTMYRTKYMTSDELMNWQKKAYHDTYFNLKYVLRRFRRMTNLTEWKATINGFKEILHATN